MKKVVIVFIFALLLIVGGSWWSNNLEGTDGTFISHNGIHWHPRLEIYVDGERQGIPSGIGLMGMHSPMHTHEDDGTIHLEFEGVVKEEDVTLGKFFHLWGKDFNHFGDHFMMTVNGDENTEYGNHVLQEEDVVKIFYGEVPEGVRKVK